MPWLEGFRSANNVAVARPGTQMVSVADHKSNNYDIFVEAQNLHAQPYLHAEFLICACLERCLTEPDEMASGANYFESTGYHRSRHNYTIS